MVKFAFMKDGNGRAEIYQKANRLLKKSKKNEKLLYERQKIILY
jgi:hypothetical protein